MFLNEAHERDRVFSWGSHALRGRGKLMFNKRSLCIVAAMLLLWVPALLAQSAGTGALTGTVKDPTGAVVPNATITLISSDTNQTRTATSGADGSYRFNL